MNVLVKLLGKVFQPRDKDGFAELITLRLRQAGFEDAVEYDAQQFKLTLAGTGATTLFLHNAYNEYLAAPVFGRSKVIEQYAKMPLLASHAKRHDLTFEQARPLLLPKVRDRFYHEGLKLNLKLEDKAHESLFTAQPLAEHLSVELVLDYPESVVIVSDKVLEDWGVTFDEALKIARENLWTRSNHEFEQVSPGLFQSPWCDSHDASRLYLHDLIWQLKARGDHVAMVPNRNTLLVCGANDAAAQVEMAKLAEEELKDTRPMTGVAFRLTNGTWTPYLPEAKSPAYWPMRKLAMRTIAEFYAEQMRLIDELNRKGKVDQFVASVQVMQRKDGSWYSFTSWVEGMGEASLPEAEHVCFGRLDAQYKTDVVGFARWEDVKRVMGQEMEKQGHYPARYLVKRFPSQGELGAMGLKPAAAAA